jgi:hypothetical protein
MWNKNLRTELQCPFRWLYNAGIIVDITAIEQVVLGHLKKRLISCLALKGVTPGGRHSCNGLVKEFGEQHGSAVKAYHAVLQARTVYLSVKTYCTFNELSVPVARVLWHCLKF